jgi:hypothetical protein
MRFLSIFLILCGSASQAFAQQLEDREQSAATQYAWYFDVNTAVIGDWVARGYRVIDIEVASVAPFRVNAALTRNAGPYAKGWWWYTGITDSQVGSALTNNNARLVDVEPYDDGSGTTKFAVVMISNTGSDAAAWSWQFNTSASGIQDHLMQHPEDRLLDLDQYPFGQRSYYSAIYIRNDGNHARTWWWYTGMAVDHMDNAARANGAMIVEIEPTGTGTFNAIMQRVPGGNPAWWWHTGVDANAVQSALSQNNARPVSVKRWATLDGDRFAVVLVSNSGASVPPGGSPPTSPPPTAAPAPSGGNGELMFWTDANLGRIEVKVNGGVAGTLTHYYPSAPACGATGNVTVTLPVGSQPSYSANCVERNPLTGQSQLQWLGIANVVQGCTAIRLTSQSTCSGGTGTGGGGVVPPGSGGGGTIPTPGGGTTPRPGNNEWRTADVIFPKGTRSVRFHLDDPYTYAADRRVYVGMQVPGQVLGWATFVYPDSNVASGGKRNSDFYFGSAPITGVPNGPPLTDGAVWVLEITVHRVGLNDFFGFHGLDGVLRIDSPRPVIKGQAAPFKAALGQKVTIKFAVSPE